MLFFLSHGGPSRLQGLSMPISHGEEAQLTKPTEQTQSICSSDEIQGSTVHVDFISEDPFKLMPKKGGFFPCCAASADMRLAFVIVDFMKVLVVAVSLADLNFYFVY